MKSRQRFMYIFPPSNHCSRSNVLLSEQVRKFSRLAAPTQWEEALIEKVKKSWAYNPSPERVLPLPVCTHLPL